MGDKVVSAWRRLSSNASPVAEAVKLFEEILYKRLPEDLIEPEATQMMIVKSGGALREFIRLASQWLVGYV